MTNYHKELLDRPITTKNCLTDQLPQRIAWPTFHPFVCLHTHTRDFEFTADTDTAHYTSHTRWVRYLLGQIFAGSDIPTHAGSDICWVRYLLGQIFPHMLGQITI